MDQYSYDAFGNIKQVKLADQKLFYKFPGLLRDSLYSLKHPYIPTPLSLPYGVYPKYINYPAYFYQW